MAISIRNRKAESLARELAELQNVSMTQVIIEALEQKKARLEQLLYHSKVEILPFSSDMRVLAADAWQRYGKGRHPAGLNIGDCCAYALASFLNDTLLFKGEDFLHTDVVRQV